MGTGEILLTEAERNALAADANAEAHTPNQHIFRPHNTCQCMGGIMKCSKMAVTTNWRKWAMTCDFQQCGILTSVDSGEPVQPPFKLRHSNDVQSAA